MVPAALVQDLDGPREFVHAVSISAATAAGGTREGVGPEDRFRPLLVVLGQPTACA